VKRGVSERELYGSLLKKIDLTAAPVSKEKAESDIFGGAHEWTSAFQAPNGIVYFLPKKNVFYVRQYPEGTVSDLYHGPFEGNPHEMVRAEREALEKARDR
jgi:hypothetical protein